ncbi:MAG: hypothetical protein SchgKO_10860 [Schleiferiaceae bacterium]
MDLLSHTLTGIAVGTVFSALSKTSWKGKTAIVLAGGLGGALPDFDAISLWSGFDATIGSALGLSHSGSEIYFGKFWYSHHGAMHSLLAPLVILGMVILFRFWRKEKRQPSTGSTHGVPKLVYPAFFFGFFFHLLEDMPTPASVWGGVNLFFPSSDYVGGYGKIWWWNNYDLFLIILSVIFCNLLLEAIQWLGPKIKIPRGMAAIVFGLGFGLFIFQIQSRPVDFSYSGHTVNYNQYEKQSLEIQRDLLGDRLYEFMYDLDQAIPLYF